jgi:hypothetical protein
VMVWVEFLLCSVNKIYWLEDVRTNEKVGSGGIIFIMEADQHPSTTPRVTPLPSLPPQPSTPFPGTPAPNSAVKH